ncbi:hypothetical protein [Synechococcus sp. JA-2-3B'a(2-13)]|jgi:hypothetical protein|uniref:hypothetical protein n=1 Tax=Synechococcus sp. (strain JA-2-3B'a(2-13)) TaxID=321332 RepID=UPI0011D162B4|nr:hypothetical protein [Synechococcus sp. JA-2-3B'a(2-13)]
MSAIAEMRGTSLLARHRQNIAASLARRLEAARAANNTRLMELLKQEERQLAAEYGGRDPFSSALFRGLRHLWQSLKEVLAACDELRVRQWVDGSGMVWWSVQDPITGERLCTHSEGELMEWIEKHQRED